MDRSEITAVEFCFGYGGLHLGLKRVVPGLRLVAACEIEGFACANLVAKMEARLLDPAPVWTDLVSFPYERFHGLVDLVAAGIPCQPHSVAGKRQGGNDERFLFDLFLDGIARMRPGLLFIENVPGLLTSRMPDGSLCIRYVLNRLEEIGYGVADRQGRPSLGVFSAEEVGAPHRRERVYLLAYRSGTGLEGLLQRVFGAGRQSPGPDDFSLGGAGPWPSRPGEWQFPWEPPRVVDHPVRLHGGRGESELRRRRGVRQASEAVGDAAGGARQRQAPGKAGHAPQPGQGTPLDDADCRPGGEPHPSGHEPERQDAGRDEAASGLGEPDPRLDDADGRRRKRGDGEAALPRPDEPDDRAPAPAGEYRFREAQSPLGGDADGPAAGLDLSRVPGLGDTELGEIRGWMALSSNRVDELRLCGNGVVPATAALAFRTLGTELIGLS